MDVRLPDGTVIQGVPDGISRADLVSQLQRSGYDVSGLSAPQEQTVGQALGRAYENVGTSAAEFGRNLVQPFIAPVETAQAIGQLGRGLYSKAQGALGVQQDPQQKAINEAAANAVGEMYSKRYGSGSQALETLATDPIGLLSDAASVLTLGGGAAARAPGIIGQAARGAQTVGATIDPLSLAARPVAAAGRYIAEPILANTLAATTGTGAEAIRAAGRAGVEGSQEFTAAMRGASAPEEAVALARSALDKMKAERSAEYNSGMVPIKSDVSILNQAPILRSLNDTKSVFTKNGFVRNKEAAGVWDSISTTIDDFRSNPAIRGTPDDFDSLKQAIGEIRSGTRQGTQSRVVADRVYNSVKDQIVKQAPAYEKTMKDYSTASKQLSDISRTFSLGEKAAPDTALRKLQSIMRNNVSTNYGERTRLADVLARYEPALPGMIAGQAMSSALPRGLSRAGATLQGGAAAILGAGGAVSPGALLAAGPILAASSPRLVGEALYAGGRARGLLGQAGVTPSNLQAVGRPAFQLGRVQEEYERTMGGLLGQ
jgi:hypothetical protein